MSHKSVQGSPVTSVKLQWHRWAVEISGGRPLACHSSPTSPNREDKDSNKNRRQHHLRDRNWQAFGSCWTSLSKLDDRRVFQAFLCPVTIPLMESGKCGIILVCGHFSSDGLFPWVRLCCLWNKYGSFSYVTDFLNTIWPLESLWSRFLTVLCKSSFGLTACLGRSYTFVQMWESEPRVKQVARCHSSYWQKGEFSTADIRLGERVWWCWEEISFFTMLSFQATCAIFEVVSALQSSKAVQELLPELFPVLLQQVSQTLGQKLPLPMRSSPSQLRRGLQLTEGNPCR